MRSHRAWLIDLDGTLYRPRPVKLAMAAQLSLFGWRAMKTIRAFREQHEIIRAEALEADGDPFGLQLRRTAEALSSTPESVEAVIRDWMVRRPGPWLRRFRRFW